MVHYWVYQKTDLDCRPTAIDVVNLITPRPSTGSKSTEVDKFLCLQCSGHSKKHSWDSKYIKYLARIGILCHMALLLISRKLKQKRRTATASKTSLKK